MIGFRVVNFARGCQCGEPLNIVRRRVSLKTNFCLYIRPNKHLVDFAHNMLSQNRLGVSEPQAAIEVEKTPSRNLVRYLGHPNSAAQAARYMADRDP
jgi:hypothetical protein